MTLQRLTRDEHVTHPLRAALRAKPLVNDRLRSIICGQRIANRASYAPSPSGNQEALIADLARILASSLDYMSTLGELTHVLANRLGCGCVIDVLEPGGAVQLAHVSDRAANVGSDAFAPLVADVVARRRTAAAALDESGLDGRRARAVAERARQETNTPWLVCAPLATEGGDALGALTIFGGATGGYVPHDLARDIAQRAAVAIKNGRLHQAALNAAHERQRVLSLVAHELKNPLGVILMGTVQALDSSRYAEPTTCPRRELEAVYRSAKRMKKLVGDLLDLASIDAGKLSIKPSAHDLGDVIESAMTAAEPCAAVAGVELVDDRPELPAAWIDDDRIEQVLLNLVSNAIKFTPRGGRVRVRCALVDRTELVVAVEDTGRGIEPADLERIFDHFWQASDTAALGSGLGLAICKSIVELSGGRIWAQSTIGLGTTVYFTVPTARD